MLNVLGDQPLIQLELVDSERIRLTYARQNVHVATQFSDNLDIHLLETMSRGIDEIETNVNPPVLKPRVSSQT